MSLRHSTDDKIVSICTICRENLGEEDLIKTKCSHTFHRNCLISWLKRNKTCPQCRTACDAKQLNLRIISNTGAITRSQVSSRSSLPDQTGDQTPGHIDLQGAMGGTNSDQQVGALDEEGRLRNIVTTILTSRHAAFFQEFEDRIARTIEERIECALTSVLDNLNIGDQAPDAPAGNENREENHSQHSWPRDMPSLTEPRVQRNVSNRVSNGNNEASVINNAGKIANLINGWDIKFDGTRKLSVENFIYRIESQVIDTLGGNFNVLCDNAQCLFIKDAKDWYWRYRRSVDRVTWPSLCQELRTNFEDHKTDTELKEDMRARKQGPTESFDDYKNIILHISENLHTPLREIELVEILQRGLRPKIRQQLLYVTINSVSQLRRLCLKSENLHNEISNSNTHSHNQSMFKGSLTRKYVNELDGDPVTSGDISTEADIDEVRYYSPKIICWNCRSEGHRYLDCVEPRTIFCYGCGSVGVFKPNCKACASGNLNRGEGSRLNLRPDHPLQK